MELDYGFPYEILGEENESLENTNYKLGGFIPLINGRLALFLNKGSLKEPTGLKYGILGGTFHILDEQFLKDYLGEENYSYHEKIKEPKPQESKTDPKKKKKSKKKSSIESDEPKMKDLNINVFNRTTLEKVKKGVSNDLLESIELDPRRELVEELSSEIIPGFQRTPLLSPQEANNIDINRLGEIAYPNKDNKGSRKTHYHRFVFEGHCNRNILIKLIKRSKRVKKSPSVLYFPTKEEMESGIITFGNTIIRISETASTIYDWLIKKGKI